MTEKTAKTNETKKTKKQPQDDGFNFEDSIEKLESLVSAMEDGDLSLEDSLAAFETGIRLTRECQSALREAEQKVQVLMNESGATVAFEQDDDEH